MPENTEPTPLALPEAKDVRWWWVKGRTKGSPKAPSEDQFDRWLAARDRENRAIGWDEARERFNDDNYRQGCVCLNADHRREHPAMHWLNPYRGDNR